jgi:ribonuclease HII
MDEKDLRSVGFNRIAGIDESGIGPGVLDVVVACVMLRLNHGIVGLRDSKKLSEKQREKLYKQIIDSSIEVSIVKATNEEIDRVNIYEATKECVYKSVVNMKVRPEFVFVDGNFTLDNLIVPYASIPGADGAQIYKLDEKERKIQIGHHYENVAAASIIAKVYRDNLVKMYHNLYPQYHWDKNKGYLTKEHRDAIKKYGITPLHRKSFNLGV